MELQHLQYFQKVAECEHMTNASIELRVAQPALSRIIKDIEEELGVPLFDRNNKRIALNENGKILQACALKIERQIAELKQELLETSVVENQQINLLLKTTPTILPELLQGFSHQYPDIKLYLLSYNKITNESNISFDFIIDCNDISEPASNIHTLFTEEMVLAVNKRHPLAGKKIPLAEAAAESFITLPSDTHNYQFFIRQCKKSGFTPKIILQTSDYYTIRQLIEANIGISFVPRYSWGFSENDIAFVEILAPSCRNNIQVLQVNQSPTPACEKFWRFVNRYQFIPKEYKSQEIETQP